MNKILRTLLLSSSLGIFIHCHENPIVKILDGSFMPVLQIKTVIPVDENKLKVQYQVPVEASSATVPGNYTLVDSNGSDVSITTSEQDIDDPTKIYLTTGDLSVSPTYSLIIRYVTANKGFAPIPEAGTTFEFDAFIRPANPLPPYKVRPLNNQQTSWNVTLEWYPGFGANSYQLKIATDINMTAILVNSTFDSAVTEYQFTASDDITHYWTVVADVSIYPPEPWSFAPLSSVYVWGDSPSSLPPIGTKDRPITTISGGLGSAVALGLADVNVSAIAAQYDESLVMPTGINLYGGFDAAAGWNRSLPTQANLWTGNETRVQATTAIAITLSALYDPAVIEGFTISTTTTGTTYLAYVVLTGNNVELRHNQLYFGGCTEDCYGIFANEGVNIVLQNNDIIGAVNTGTGENYGIHCFKCGMTIDGNTIEAGGTINDPSNSYGIYLDESNPSVTNNTIWGGNAFTKSYGMMIDFSSAPIIMGNTITGGSGESSYGIYVQNLSTPDISSGNVISGGDATIGSLGLYVNSQNLTVMGNTINGGTGLGSSGGAYFYGENINVINNQVNGGPAPGTGPSTGYSYGMQIINPVAGIVAQNIITSDSAGEGSYGVHNQVGTGSVNFNNNIVIAGAGGNYSYGVHNRGTWCFLYGYNNIIVSGPSPLSYGLVGSAGMRLDMYNSIIITTGTGNTRWAVGEIENSNAADPRYLQNNAIWDAGSGGSFYFFREEASINHASLLSFEGASVNYFGNIVLPSDPFADFANNDFHLSQNGLIAAEWLNLRFGGKDVSSQITDDFESAGRTLGSSVGVDIGTNTNAGGYSIGAYEVN